jgi:hypothetical protein
LRRQIRIRKKKKKKKKKKEKKLMLVYNALFHEITVQYVPDDGHTIDRMVVEVDGKFIASFPLAIMWDELVSILQSLDNSTNPGIARRHFEASRVPSATKEWIDRESSEAEEKK